MYERLFTVAGLSTTPLMYAVYAEWQIADPELIGAWLERSRRVFAIRQRVLASFAFDWMLQRRDHVGRYLVLGVYGDKDGATRLCRDHPEIKRFLQAHPAAAYTATDVSGMHCFRIETPMDASRTTIRG